MADFLNAELPNSFSYLVVVSCVFVCFVVPHLR